MTEIILQQDVDDLGTAGEVVDVKPGYARNYLLPQGMAIRATEGNLKRLEEERRHLERAAERELEVAEEKAAALQDVSFTFTERAGEEGKLFGSVTAADIAQEAADQGVRIEEGDIEMESPIKELGAYTVTVDLHEDVRPDVKVWVVAEE